MIDVRQSVNWATYLQSIKWKSFRTSKGINIEMRKTILGTLVKVQKAANLDKSDLDEIDKICRAQKALFIKIEPYVGQDVSVLENAGYVTSPYPMTPPSTYFIDLEKSEEELWKNISQSGKYRINRGRREGATVEIISEPDEKRLREYYEVLKVTGKKKKFYVPPIKQLFSQAKAFGKNGFLTLVYDKDKNLCGAKWYVADDGMVLYISGGTSPFGRNDKSGYELLWQAILYFKKLGFKVLDLEGKDDSRFKSLTAKWGGFSHFKEKFGGEAKEFPVPYVKYLSPVLKIFKSWFGLSI